MKGNHMINGNTGRTLSVMAIIVAFAILSGCSSGPRFSLRTPPPDKALVYIYREGGMVGAARSYRILVNQKHLVNMWGGSYYAYEVEPSAVSIATDLRWTLGIDLYSALASTPTERINFFAEAGKTYYVKLINVFSMNSSSCRMQLIDPAIAVPAIRKCRLAESQE